ncbi:MAG: GNAT family N-acetyltransferase [Rhodospirillaceae bacterium]|jgi:GNAT superfamily N-acetyltransferase|nr:GNAT family N-acetyltransferase [Rhodospirillaceae bacterium]MBT3493908.1 GNAT family N-acetyltransferase [Rhodospirillaceae bacterium]MBT3780777.1 GNAT family N-acetyltransferase [Rhodospirillaceae bacterium]MBT3976204.1 GNAT family N-acetyltransferase [Rhodospirillaceae bacterium]MBT4167355.1 GNAT family N-acetyltransferase [Rhodospirillaceae bacterium]
MATIENLIWQDLAVAEVDEAVALNVEAGWNQNAADWQLMLEMGEGTGVRERELVASSMLLPHGDRFAWIAMILVTARWQRKGLASQLMHRCIARAEELNLVAGLDATEAGRKVYLPLGFEDIYALTRWQAEDIKLGLPDGVRPMLVADLDAVAAWDARIFGAARPGLLTHLHGRCPERAFVLQRDGALQGFVLARDGRQATQIGPLSAESEADAQALLQAALADHGGPVFLDAADHHKNLARWLAAAGFSKQRGYMRMLLGTETPIDDPARVFLIAGPELG